MPLRLLADENLPHVVVEELSRRGHYITWVRLDAPGSPDHQVLARAVAENRILITFDKDFGELAFRSRLPAATGIVLFRVDLASPAYVTQVVVSALES